MCDLLSTTEFIEKFGVDGEIISKNKVDNYSTNIFNFAQAANLDLLVVLKPLRYLLVFPGTFV